MKLFNLFVTLSLFIIITSATFGQATVKGKLTDFDTKEAIPFASVISEKGAGAASDFDGLYEFKIAPGEHKIKFSCINYTDTTLTINVKEGENTINLKLMKQTVRLNITTVVGGKFAKELAKEIVTVDVLGKDLISNTNSYDISKAVEKVPGVSIVDGQANIRGGSGWSYGAGSRVLVMVDEIPLLTADAADVKWSFIPTENVEQVEVVKGAASALYGSSALNGVIDVRTAWPKDSAYTKIVMNTGFYENPNTSSYIWWGRNQPAFGNGNFVHRRKIGQVDLVVSGSFSGDKSYLQGADGFDYRGTMKLRWRLKKVAGLSLGVAVNAYNSIGTTFFLWNGIDSSIYKPLPKSSTAYSDLRITVDPFISYFDKYENQYKLNLRYFNAKNTNSTNQGSVPIQYYGEFQYTRQLKRIGMNIVAGTAVRIDDVSSPNGNDSLSLNGTHRGTNYAAYGQLEQTLFKKLTLAFGVRFEYFKIDSFVGATKPLLRFGLNYQVGQATFIRGSIGQGYRFPSIAEKFVSTSIGGIGIYPNPKLQNETGWSAELGIKQGIKLGKWLGYVDLTGFVNYYDNMIEFNFGQYGNPNDPTKLLGLGFSAQNVGKTRIAGGELTLVGQGKLGKFPFTVLGGYTYIDPHSLNWNDTLTLYKSDGTLAPHVGTKNGLPTYEGTSSSDNNTLKYRFRHTLKFDAQLDVRKFEFGASVNYTSFMENVDYIFVSKFLTSLEGALNTHAFSGLVTYRELHHRGNTDVGIRAGYNITKKIKVMVIVKNLLNQDIMIRPTYMSPPRNYTAQLSVEF